MAIFISLCNSLPFFKEAQLLTLVAYILTKNKTPNEKKYVLSFN